MSAITFSKAVEGYLMNARGRQLSEHTLADYANTFGRFAGFLAPADPVLASIDLAMIEAFFAGLNGLSRKTVSNYHVGLSALWTWAVNRGVVDEHIIRRYRPPRPEDPLVEIFTEDEVQRLLYACERTPAYIRPGKKKCSNAKRNVLRDKAIILALLDSMTRVGELCGMLRSEMSLGEGRIRVRGKGGKERYVPISQETAEAIWQYIAERPRAKPQYDDLVFLTVQLRPMNRFAVNSMLKRTGNQAGVRAHAHKFRHTGATQFLRNGGNVFELKAILGHSTMRMVERYVHLAQVDIEEAHRRASPVYNWDLRV